MIPHIDADNRHAVIFVNDQRQAVIEHEFLEFHRVTAAVEFGRIIRLLGKHRHLQKMRSA